MLLLTLLLLFASVQSGLLAMQKGQYIEARNQFEQATKADPQDAVAWVSLAETCRRLQALTEANEAARHAAETSAGNPAVAHALAAFYAAQGQFLEAGKWEELYAQSPKADAEAVVRAAEFYQRAGTAADAQRTLQAGWLMRKSDPQISFQLAKLLLQKLDFTAAAETVATARKAHPQDAQLVLVSGVANYGERRFPEAVNDLLAVIAIDPSIPQPYQFLGRMLEHAGPRLPELIAAFSRRVQQTPTEPLPYLVLAKAKLAANPTDPAAADLLQRSLALDNRQWEAHYELGVLLEGKRDFQSAAAQLKQAINLDPKQPMPHYHLARVYDRLGNSANAQAERQLHQQLTPP